jgi:hypothetical protein
VAQPATRRMQARRPPVLVVCSRERHGAGWRCTTGFKNAHETVFRELLYHWHPWFGMRVAIHEAVDKADGVVFRCTLSGSAADRWLEVPAWMFERAMCPDRSRLTTSPFVSMDALSALSDLLRQTLKSPLSSSNAPHSGASKSSHDQNRGEAHDHAKPGATASAEYADRADGTADPGARSDQQRGLTDGGRS